MKKVKNITIQIKVKRKILKNCNFLLTCYYPYSGLIYHFGRIEKPKKEDVHEVGCWRIKKIK